MKIRQGAEKAWNASVQATKAFAAKLNNRMPRNYNAQVQFLLKLEKEHPDLLNGYPFLIVFKAFASRLHGECFYHGEYVVGELDHDFESVKNYMGMIKRVNS